MDRETDIEKSSIRKKQVYEAEELYHSCAEAKALLDETNEEIYRQINYMEAELEEMHYLWNKRNLTGNLYSLMEETYQLFADAKSSTFSAEEAYDELDYRMKKLEEEAPGTK